MEGLEIKGIIVLVLAVFFGLRMLKMRRAMTEDIDLSSCVACGSTDLVEVGPNAMRCNACGYESGEGHQQMKDAEFARKVEATAPEQRLASGKRHLAAAQVHLLAAEGTFKGALADSGFDMLGSSDASDQKNIKIVSGYGEMLHAQKELRRAAQFLNDETLAGIKEGREAFDFSSPVFGLDHNYEIPGAGLVAEMMVHGKIRQAQRDAERMKTATERALAALERAGDGYRQGLI